MTQNTDNRDRGILTPTDRKYLRGEQTYDNPQTDAHRRRDIRDRVRDSILDFELLLEELDPEERQKIFADVMGPDRELTDALEQMLAFVCLGVSEDQVGRSEYSDWLNEIYLRDFDQLVQGAVRNAFREIDFIVTDVNSNVSVRGYSETRVALLKNVFSAGHADSPRPQDVKMLLEVGEIDQEALIEFLSEHVSPPEDTNQWQDLSNDELNRLFSDDLE